MIFVEILAQIDVNSQDYKNGYLIGQLLSGAVCGLWPLFVGIKKGRPVLGAVSLLICAPCGYLLGCLLALPIAFVFKLLLSALPEPAPSRYGSSDMRCGRCGVALMAGDAACFSCRQPVGRADTGAVSVAAIAAAAAVAIVSYVLVQRLFAP